MWLAWLVFLARLAGLFVARLTPKRRRAQFSLGTMLVVVTMLCVGLSLVVAPAQRQRRAVAAIEALDGTVKCVEPDQEASEAFLRPFLRRWLPRDYFDEVREVYLVFIQDPDAGLAHLQGLTGLQHVYLDGTQVTDAGLMHLQGLTGLRTLYLRDTQVTDAGLAHLYGLTGLHELFLVDTQVTDAGLAQLRQALPNLEE